MLATILQHNLIPIIDENTAASGPGTWGVEIDIAEAEEHLSKKM